MKMTHLTFTYPGASENLLDDLSLDIVPGTVNILLGMNGAGKTTLFDIIAGLIPLKDAIRQPIPRQNILYHIQGVPMLHTIRGKDLAELILCGSGCYRPRDLSPLLFAPLFTDDRQTMQKIAGLWNRQYGKMSPGERRWFTILLDCLLDKTLYLFDEPTAGVDPLSAAQIAAQIERLQRTGKSVLLTTHRVEDVRLFAHYHLHMLDRGKIVLSEDEKIGSSSRGKACLDLRGHVRPHSSDR